jgi:hypothetical protein
MKCRVCGNENLVKVVDLGVQYLTGIFPRSLDEIVSKGPLTLVKCHPFGEENVCSLLQLSESFDLDEMYGANYGYRSGLNPSMVRHLQRKIDKILALKLIGDGDLVLDIGSNDGTTLGFYPSTLRRIGIDPTGAKFSKFYSEGIDLIPSFFSSKTLLRHTNNKKVKVVTSFSMFYDLESPVDFCRQIRDVLDPDGCWVFEQSYMPAMLEKNSFDTICHEHLEYYGLEQILWILERANLKIVDVELNDVNGGSFSVTAAHKESSFIVSPAVGALLDRERILETSTLQPYREFYERISSAGNELKRFLLECRASGKRVAGLGASTKGNVLLQYLNLTTSEIEAIGEVNPDKFGCFTPGTSIPIVNESDLISSDIDYFLVLPWHFREYFLSCGRYSGKKLIFPLPHLEIVKV